MTRSISGRVPYHAERNGPLRNGYVFVVICSLLVLLYLVDFMRKAFRAIFSDFMRTHELYFWMYVLGGIAYNYIAVKSTLKKRRYGKVSLFSNKFQSLFYC